MPVDEGTLKSWLRRYHNPDIAFKDVTTVTRSYMGLTPLQEAYIFNDGSRADLLNLTGTIPVNYKDATYNIPICIWLMDTHPKNAPICYVKPTSDMSIKISMFVDQNGKIYLPYLHDWVPNSSDLLGLIQVMIVTFGEQPPVFAKRKDYSMVMPSHNMPVPNPGSSSFYPPASFMPGFPPYPAPNRQPVYPPYPTSFPSYPMPYPMNGSSSVMPTPGGGNAGTIKDEHIRESLLTGIEELLMRRMKEQFHQNQAELDTLKRTQDELRQGKAKLDSIMSQLEKEQYDLDRNITMLKDKEQDLDKAIQNLNGQESIDVDDAVITTAPLYKQLLNAYAEEAALEDAIYYMGEALRCNVIDLDVFLRHVRTLSRKQFMLRALMQKCRQKAGLSV